MPTKAPKEKTEQTPTPEEIMAAPPEEGEKQNPYRINSQYLQKMQGGKQHLTWPGLLDLGHHYVGQDGKPNPIRSIETSIIQFPSDANNNTCICQATVVMTDGSIFTEVGDANPQNVGKMVAPHLIRMAATRAKGRALRDAVNVGEAIEEEMGGNTNHTNPSFAPVNPLHTQLRMIWAEGGERKEKVRQFIVDNVPPGTAITSFQDLTELNTSLLQAAIAAGG